MLFTSKGKTKSTQELIAASLDVLVKALESGHSELLSSYLKAMAKFHYYSFGNIVLIAGQRPEATQVAGLRSWNELGRRVKRGEKGILIFAPLIGWKRKQTDAENSSPENSNATPSDARTAQPEKTLIGFVP